MPHECHTSDSSFSLRYTPLGDQERSLILRGIGLILLDGASDWTILRVIELLKAGPLSQWQNALLENLERRLEPLKHLASSNGLASQSEASREAYAKRLAVPDSTA